MDSSTSLSSTPNTVPNPVDSSLSATTSASSSTVTSSSTSSSSSSSSSSATANIATALPIIRKYLSDLKIPQPHDRVYKSECCYSFDTPETTNGLFINLLTKQAVSERYLSLDRKRTGGQIYLQEEFFRIPKPVTASNTTPNTTVTTNNVSVEGTTDNSKKPTKLGINVEGGFQTDIPPYEIKETYTLIIFTSTDAQNTNDRLTFPYRTDATKSLPEFLLSVCEAIIGHKDGAVSNTSLSAWEEQVQVSIYALELPQLTNGKTVSPFPTDWHCDHPNCDKKENLWLNLSDGFIGCGRKQPDGSGGNGHALHHYESTGSVFPLCVKLGTITPGGGDVYSYAPNENDMVEDPHLAKHLAHFGINIMKMEKTEKTMDELNLNYNLEFIYGRICESGTELKPVSQTGFIGLENLGNTCYMNSIMQVITSIPELRQGWSHSLVRERLYETVTKGSSVNSPVNMMEDLLALTSKLFSGMYDSRYINPNPVISPTVTKTVVHSSSSLAQQFIDSTTKETIIEQSNAGISNTDSAILTHTTADDINALPNEPKQIPPGPGTACGFVVPRTYRILVGKDHPEFRTNRQQDAVEFFEYLCTLYERAYKKEKQRIAPVTIHQTIGSSSNTSSSSSSDTNSSSLNVIVPSSNGAIVVPPALPALFQYTTESRLQCQQSQQVQYSKGNELFLRLPIPLTAATNTKEVKEITAIVEAMKQEKNTTEGNEAKRPRTEGMNEIPTIPRLQIPAAACFQQLAAPGIITDWLSPATNIRGTAITTHRLATFPPYLNIVMNRYTLTPDWRTMKIDAEVPMPIDLDLENLPGSGNDGQIEYGNGVKSLKASGMQPNELPFASNVTVTAPVAPTVDAEMVSTLISMGFPEGACIRAVIATNNVSAEIAMEWLITHTDDPNFNDPYVPPAPASTATVTTTGSSSTNVTVEPDAGLIAMIESMGFSAAKAKRALRATQNDGDRAMDWLFSHMEENDDEEETTTGSNTTNASNTNTETVSMDPSASVRGKYTLMAIISHMGTSTASGHYVAHIRKTYPEGKPPSKWASEEIQSTGTDQKTKWYLYNDEKVAESVNPPLEAGYMYIYRRIN